MAKIKESVTVGLTPEEAFGYVSDLQSFDEWLVVHDGWRSELPEVSAIKKGTKAASIIKAKGVRIRFEWTVEQFDPPLAFKIKGNGKGGVKASIAVQVKPVAEGSFVNIEIELGGLPLIGPAGMAAAKAIKGDLEQSLENFANKFG